MKKSEMIKLIGDELYDILPAPLCKYADNDAARILRIIEEAGMMPPINEAKSFDILQSGQMTYEVYEWEPEND